MQDFDNAGRPGAPQGIIDRLGVAAGLYQIVAAQYRFSGDKDLSRRAASAACSAIASSGFGGLFLRRVSVMASLQ